MFASIRDAMPSAHGFVVIVMKPQLFEANAVNDVGGLIAIASGSVPLGLGELG
jgi:hypothetical protein